MIDDGLVSRIIDDIFDRQDAASPQDSELAMLKSMFDLEELIYGLVLISASKANARYVGSRSKLPVERRIKRFVRTSKEMAEYLMERVNGRIDDDLLEDIKSHANEYIV